MRLGPEYSILDLNDGTEPQRETGGRFRRLLRDHRGFSLVLVTAILGITVTLGFVLSSVVLTDMRSSSLEMEAAQALAAADAGVELAAGWLRRQPSPPATLEPIVFARNLQIGDATIDVTIIPDQQNRFNYLKRFTVQVGASSGNVARSVSVDVRMASFSDYVYLTNDEGSGIIWYITGDIIDGKLHSNDRLYIWGRPIFRGPVTSAASSFGKGGSYNPDFQAGYKLGVPRIDLPTLQEILANYQAYGSGNPFTIYSKRNKRAKLIFKVVSGVGKVAYSGWDRSGHAISGTVALDNLDGLIRVIGNVNVRGKIKGRVTVLAQRLSGSSGGNIHIRNDLRYAGADANGRPLPGCEDRLGLISEANIIIDNTAPNRHDVIIDAALLALGHSFTVEKYWSGGPRGTIKLWGSVSQDIRGPVGTFGRHGMTGYMKEYHYDQRLRDAPPPYFPASGEYIVENWRQSDS